MTTHYECSNCGMTTSKMVECPRCYPKQNTGATAMTQKYKLAPIEPTEEMWSGLARAIMMGRDLECNKAHEMRKHLERGGNEIPAWLDKELDGEKHLAKGDMVVMIYKAMLEAAPKPEPAETVEGLAEAIEWAIASNWVSYGIDGGAEIKNKVIIKWNEAILQAARLWLRKQGE